MEASEIERTLIQVLDCCRRSGMTHVLEKPASELDPELLEAVALLQADSAPVSTSAGNTTTPTPAKPESPTPQSSSAAPSPTPAKPQPTPINSSGLFTSETPSAASGSWTLPVLDMAERQTEFEKLEQQAKDCRHCKQIVDFRQQTVFGSGSLDATVCFMGEAPGADEDRQGLPFVGRAGQLLTKIIQAMKLSRDEVYILNALKCRPPQNRTPVPEEIQSCRPFVENQLEVIQPKYIVCLGAVAVRSLLQCDLPIGRLRGKFYNYKNAKVVVTYHPSYLLRNENAKRFVWDDMKMLMRDMGTLES